MTNIQHMQMFCDFYLIFVIYYYICFKLENRMGKEKKERTVIHVQMTDKHYYFGSLAAIFEIFSKEEIGISYGSLRNYGLTEDKLYQNKLVIIRKGILTTIPKRS